MKRFHHLVSGVLAILLLALSSFVPAACADDAIRLDASLYPIAENGSYSSMEEVAVYLTAFHRLPPNYLTKKQAQAMGWDSRSGNLDAVAPGAVIGGDRFGNYEQNPDLPANKVWRECDVNFRSGYRGGERIVFSEDGLIFYSSDHYATFRRIIVTAANTTNAAAVQPSSALVQKDGSYTSKDEVAAYLRRFGNLPANYLTKKEAQALGWSPSMDNLGIVAPGSAIGGDAFGNREGLLPHADGRTWKECDVNSSDGKRSDERIVYSNDGLLYFSPDRHRSFIQLY